MRGASLQSCCTTLSQGVITYISIKMHLSPSTAFNSPRQPTSTPVLQRCGGRDSSMPVWILFAMFNRRSDSPPLTSGFVVHDQGSSRTAFSPSACSARTQPRFFDHAVTSAGLDAFFVGWGGCRWWEENLLPANCWPLI